MGWRPSGAPDDGREMFWSWSRSVLRCLYDWDETTDAATHVDACGDVFSDGGAIPPGSTTFFGRAHFVRAHQWDRTLVLSFANPSGEWHPVFQLAVSNAPCGALPSFSPS